MNIDRWNGWAACCTIMGTGAAIVAGVALGLAKLLQLGVVAMMGAADNCFTHMLLMGLGILLMLGAVLPVGLASCIVLALCGLVLAAGILWLAVAGVARAVGSRRGVREEGGVRVKYLHWSGGWRDGWRGVRRPGTTDVPPVGFWHLAADLWRAKGVPSAGQDEQLARIGERAVAPVYFALRAPVVAVLWGLRAAVATALRVGVRARKGLRECRECHGWTVSPGWRCPHCGAVHQRLGPSAKFGLWEWRCACGGRLPTLVATGRRTLEAVCPDCGGTMDPVERGRADMAFLGDEREEGKTLLWQEAVAALSGNGRWRLAETAGTEAGMATLAETAGRRHMRLYDAPGKTILDASVLVRQRYWGHIGTVVFAVDPGDIATTEKTWESWMRVMDREHPDWGRRMACAVVLVNSPAGTTLSRGDGDKEGRAFLERVGAGNLLNGLDAKFRRVKVFATGKGEARSNTALWTWSVEQLFLNK